MDSRFESWPKGLKGSPGVPLLADTMRRIAVVVDSPNWVQAQRAKDLQPHLDGYGLETVKTSDFACNIRTVPGLRYDGVWIASWRSALAHPAILDAWPTENMMVSVTSHYQIGGGLNPEVCFRKGTDPAGEFEKAIGVLRQFKVVTCNSKILESLLRPHLPGIVLAQNGVDTEFFKMQDREFDASDIAVGWNGKRKAAKNLEIFRGTRLVLGNPFLILLLEAGKRGESPMAREFMPGWYGSLDFYICASLHEGTPNPCLEAAACGLPVITTEVGNMPELVREGETGWFIEPTAKSLIACLERLQYLEPWKYREMSKAIRAEVEANWTWEKRAGAFRTALEELCATQPAVCQC